MSNANRYLVRVKILDHNQVESYLDQNKFEYTWTGFNGTGLGIAMNEQEYVYSIFMSEEERLMLTMSQPLSYCKKAKELINQ
jgi:hypothetical protein